MSARLTLRMAAPSVVISLLLLALGGLGGWYIFSLQKSTASLVALDMATMRAVEQLVLSVTEVRSELAEFLATGDRAHLEAIPVKCAQTEEWLRETESLVDDEDEIALTARIRDGFRRFLAESKALPKAPPDSARRTIARLNSDLSVRGLLAPAKELLAREEQLNWKSRDYNLGMAGRIAMILGLLAICGSAAGLVAGVGIARSVTRSIVELYVPVRAVSGKLEEVVGPVDIPPGAGIENLDVLLHRMADDVGTVVDRLRQSELDVLRGEQLAALGQLAAGLAHELRNPLTAMKILIQAAIEKGPSASLAGRDLAVLEAETTRLERSIQTFLDFARPPTSTKWSADIRQALGQTLDLVRARADRQGVRIQCDPDAGELLIEADHEELRQLFLNLLLNALDILPNGGTIRIVASLSAEAPPEAGAATNLAVAATQTLAAGPPPGNPASWVTISIADNGPGIAERVRDRIFDPYVSTKDGGLGLGLAICRRIVETHGGQIVAGNAAGGGAVFTVRLPKFSPAAEQTRLEHGSR